jgi:dihydrofolate reductase
MFNIIVAFDINRGIGINNRLPWHIPDDLKQFQKLTRGNGKNAVIMGKNTWNSLPVKMLAGRDNLILSLELVIE